MNFKKSFLILALGLFLACPLTAAAQEGPPADPKDFAQLESLQDQFWAKKMELKALQQAGNVQETRTVIGEMTKLKAQIRAERRRLGDSAGLGRETGFCDCPGGGPKGWGPGGKPSHKGGHGGKER